MVNKVDYKDSCSSNLYLDRLLRKKSEEIPPKGICRLGALTAALSNDR
jgi:hypothetical protein